MKKVHGRYTVCLSKKKDEKKIGKQCFSEHPQIMISRNDLF